MLKNTLIALALVTALPVAVHADDRAEFDGFVAVCMEEHGTIDKLLIPCIEDHVASKENYLSDILIEAEGIVAEDQIQRLHAAQAAWESYRDTSCAYHAAFKPRDDVPRAQMCRLRLVNGRIAEILAHEDFAEFGD